MTTQVNITVSLRSLYEKIKAVQAAARAAQLEKERLAEIERRANGQDQIISRRRNSTFQNGLSRQDPTSFYSGSAYYWLPVRAWIFDNFSYNAIEKKTTVTIRGEGDTDVTYVTLGEGGDSVLNLLNGKDSSYDTLYGVPYLPEGTTVTTGPYVSLYSGEGLDKARKTLENAEPGLSETDPSKYILHHKNQLPVGDGDFVKFYKPFYNVYLETLDNTKVVSFATEPKKFNRVGNLTANSTPVNHGKTFEANNSSLFMAYHVYLIGRYETGTVTIKPAGTSNPRDLHVFINEGRDRNGFYFLGNTGNSRFAVGDMVYVNNYSLTFSEPGVYRYGTIIEISRGTFTYQNIDPEDPNTRTETGLRIVVRLPTTLGLDLELYHRLFNTTIVKLFTDIEEALTSQDALWVDQLRLLGGYQNAWVKETIEEEELATPELKAAFVGDSFLDRDGMDCSKGGKAYFIQSAFIAKDSPVWKSQNNYHDGDIVAQRPGNNGEESFQDRSIFVRFFELDCASNAITNTYTTQQESTDISNVDLATWAAMPDWFPSKRYRQAGYIGQLNLNKTETFASRNITRYDNSTQINRHFIKSWPIDPTLPINELVQMVRDEAGASEIEVTQSLQEMQKEISIPEDSVSGWGYTNTTEYFVSA